MSDSKAYGAVTVSADGVGITKQFEEDEFPVPAIAFDFTSERDEPVTVRVVDQVPEDIEVEDLGFHPEYGSEYWTIEEEEIVFERELEANANYTTVYGIRATGAEDVEQFLTQPEIEEVDPPLPEGEDPAADVLPENEDEIVREAISGHSEVPEVEGDGEDVDDEDVEPLDLKDPSTEETGGGGPPVETGTSGGIDEETDTAPAADLAGALAREIREGEVAEDDLEVLREALDLDEDDGAVEARIERLQSDIADLRAYTDALEEFLGENGTGEQLIADFEDQVETLSDDVDRVESELTSNADSLDTLSADVEGVDEELSDVHESVSDLETAVDDVEATLDELEEEVAGQEVVDRLDDLDGQVADLKEWQEQIKQTFGG